MITLAAATVLVPFLATLAGLLVDRAAAGVAVLGAAGCAALTVLLRVVAGDAATEVWRPFTPTGSVPIVLGLHVDPLSTTVAAMVALVALAVQVFSAGLLRDDPRYRSFAALVSLFTAAMLTVVLGADLVIVYVGWEVMGVCSYLLIGHRVGDRPSTAAALKAFLMTRVGDVAFLFGILLLGRAAGSFRVTAVLDAVPAMDPATLTAATMLVTAGVVAKSGQFPLHSWLPDAMAAPAPVSALIHAATMVAAGVYLVVLLYPAFRAAPVTLAVLGIVAAVTMLGAALAALGAEDLKRVLAWSTISQLALMFGVLAVGGTAEAIGHLLAHAAFKALLFLSAGAVAVAVGSTLLARTGGLRRRMPLTFGAASIGVAALVALPPTSGFVSKDGVLAALWHAGGPLGATLLTSALVTTALTGAYATRAWLRVFWGTGPDDARDPSALLTAPQLALAVPALALGALLGLLTGAPPVEAGVAVVGIGCALAGVLAGGLAWRRSWSAPRVLATAFGTDTFWERVLVPPVLALAARVVRADDGVGAAVSGTGTGAGGLGRVLRRSQTGNPQLYVTAMLAGTLVAAAGVVVLW